MTNVPKSFTFIHHTTGMICQDNHLSMIQRNHMLCIFKHLTHRNLSFYTCESAANHSFTWGIYYIWRMCVLNMKCYLLVPSGIYAHTWLSHHQLISQGRMGKKKKSVYVCVGVVKYVKSQNLPLHADTHLHSDMFQLRWVCRCAAFFVTCIHPPTNLMTQRHRHSPQCRTLIMPFD